MLHLYDLLETLVRELKPTSYLEVGCYKGASLASVVRTGPINRAVLCDDWSYTGAEYETVVRICEENIKEYELLVGNSHVVLKDYFRNHPDEMFDLTLVDGDHTVEGALDDLSDCWPHSRCLVFHDISHPAHLYLNDVFDAFVEGLTLIGEEASSYKVDVLYGAGVIVRQ